MQELCDDHELTEKQALFCLEYLKDLNGTRAALRAGFAQSNASQASSGMLADPKVARFLQERMKARVARLHMDADDVLRELTLLAKSDVRDFVISRKSGKLKLRVGADDLAWRAVSSVKYRTHTVQMANGKRKKIHECDLKLWSKTDALRLLREHMGLTREVQPHVDVPALITAITGALKQQAALDGFSPTPSHAPE